MTAELRSGALNSMVPLPPGQGEVVDRPHFTWGKLPSIAQQLEHNPGVHRKRFYRLLLDAVNSPVYPDNGNNRTVGHAITEMLVNCALAGEQWAVKEVLDRVDGKAVQGMDFTAPDGSPSDGGSVVSAFFAKFMAGDDTEDIEDAETVEIAEELTDLERMQRGIFGDDQKRKTQTTG